MAALYLESSALLAAMLEADASTARSLASADVLVTSRLTFTEARRALRRAQLNRRINAGQRTELLRRVAELESRCRIIALDEAVFAAAEGEFPVEHVATLDALHLASMLVYQREVGPIEVASRDERVRANAQALGFGVVPKR